jgi:hypothetical protein
MGKYYYQKSAECKNRCIFTFNASSLFRSHSFIKQTPHSKSAIPNIITYTHKKRRADKAARLALLTYKRDVTTLVIAAAAEHDNYSEDNNPGAVVVKDVA